MWITITGAPNAVTLIAVPAVILGWFFGRRTWVGVVAAIQAASHLQPEPRR